MTSVETMKTPIIIAATVIGVLGTAGAATAVNAGAFAFIQPDTTVSTSTEIVPSQTPVDPSAAPTEPAVDSESTTAPDPVAVEDTTDDSSSYPEDGDAYEADDVSDDQDHVSDDQDHEVPEDESDD